MATNRYITLQSGSGGAVYRFRVLADEFVVLRERSGKVGLTITGKVDQQSGPVLNRYQVTLKVYDQDPEAASGFGNIGDLRSLLALTTPPANKLVMGLPTGQTIRVYVDARSVEKNITYMLDGPQACYRVGVEFVEVVP